MHIERTTTPEHFEKGEWDSRPVWSGPLSSSKKQGGGSFELLDTTMLSHLRPDGHLADSWNDLMIKMLHRIES
ncbi:trichome birefringence-like [Salvia divinorum]|uniref:Trichome birefringence-like n=1 Tax=Salvia divinorum TaxID=28513 RepID=A0ABD1HZN8_SALDI